MKVSRGGQVSNRKGCREMGLLAKGSKGRGNKRKRNLGKGVRRQKTCRY